MALGTNNTSAPTPSPAAGSGTSAPEASGAVCTFSGSSWLRILVLLAVLVMVTGTNNTSAPTPAPGSGTSAPEASGAEHGGISAFASAAVAVLGSYMASF